MNKILNNYSLKNLNSFGIDIKAKLFSNFNSENELIKLLSNKSLEEKSVFILGDGSNILFTKDFEGLVLANKINGIDIISEDQTSMTIRVGAGENWHDFCIMEHKKRALRNRKPSLNSRSSWRISNSKYWRLWCGS